VIRRGAVRRTLVDTGAEVVPASATAGVDDQRPY
jgi:hypothetical protein